MTRYERRILSVSDGVYHVQGRIVEVLDAPRGGRNTITVLVETDSERSTDEELSVAPEGVRDKSTFFCQGTKGDGGRCSREVDEPGERCFQHPRDDE